MTHSYAPNGTTWEPDVTLIDDSDVPTAANLNQAGTGNGDRTQFLHDHMANAALVSYGSNGSWVVPAGVTRAIVMLFGGGGGGGAAYGGNTAGGSMYPGAGGGAGARKAVGAIVTVPGETLSITVGAGGAGGAGGASGSSPTLGTKAASGGNSAVFRSATPLITGYGAACASRVIAGGDATSAGPSIQYGGNGPAYGFFTPDYGGIVGAAAALNPWLPSDWGMGGVGLADLARALGFSAFPSIEGFQGGAEGTYGTTSGSQYGGGPGGGGGGGPAGPGGNGGNGGNGAASAGLDGSAGVSAGANTGGGGGGGGGCGSGGTTGGAGGSGGNGGTGLVQIFWVEYDVSPV